MTTKTKNEDKNLKELEKITKELFTLMKVSPEVEIVEDKENDLFSVNLKSEDEKGLLIGKKGETISAIQMVLGMILKNRTGEWKRIQVNIGEWREKQEEYLKLLALKSAQRAKETGEPQKLYNLNSTQRRIIHMEVAEVQGVVSESEGEGSERCLIIKPE